MLHVLGIYCVHTHMLGLSIDMLFILDKLCIYPLSLNLLITENFQHFYIFKKKTSLIKIYKLFFIRVQTHTDTRARNE